MTQRLKIAIVAIGLLLATSAFADTYQFTVNFDATAGVGPGSVTFTSNSLTAPGSNTLLTADSVTAPTGFFLAQLSWSPATCCSTPYISVVWDVNGNPSQYMNEILSNNSYSDWSLGTTAVSGNYGSDFAGSGQGNTGTVTVTDITTPEPASLALLGSGLIGLAGTLRRKFLR